MNVAISKSQLELTCSSALAKRILQAGVAACLLMVSTVSRADPFHISVNTTGLTGSTGFIDLQLNPGDSSAPAATALIFGFGGSVSLNGVPQIEGGVSGTLPGPVSLVNSTAFNDYFHAVQFGQTIFFDVDFSGPFGSQPSAIGSSFALSLYASDGITPLSTIDPSGSIARFELFASGITYQTFAATQGGVSIAQVSAVPVPVPAAIWLFLSGCVGLFGFRRRGSV